MEDATRRVADEIISKSKVKLEYLVGTMIEFPRAALLADQIAEVAEFFSFGTNDLTKPRWGFPGTMPWRFLPDTWIKGRRRFLRMTLSRRSIPEGVGDADRVGHRRDETRPKLKIGICGEHGGDAESVKFCHQVGMNYVSASPFRVPIARLAAAQAVIEDKRRAKGKGKGEIAARKHCLNFDPGDLTRGLSPVATKTKIGPLGLEGRSCFNHLPENVPRKL